MKELIYFYILTVLISAFLGLIFTFRGVKKYKKTPLPGKCLYRIAWMIFSLPIPGLNILVYVYYSIFLFDNILKYEN